MSTHIFFLKVPICIIGFFTVFASYSQTVKIQITDEEQHAIPNALAIKLEDQSVTVSDDQGYISISTGRYQFSQLGYLTKTADILTNSRHIILEADPILLAKITVNGQTQARPLIDEHASISILNLQHNLDLSAPNYAMKLNQVPGLFMHSGSINTNRITIRGIGSRSSFDTEKVRAYLSNIPLTNGSGQTTVEDLDLNLIGRMEIIKGPGSSQYGNSLGGTLLIHPESFSSENNSVDANIQFGSFGYRQSGLVIKGSKNKHQLVGGGQWLRSDGYRRNNEVNRNSLLLSHRYQADKLTLYTIGYVVDQLAFIPSSLSQSAVIADRRQAASTWAQSQGYEQYKKLLLGTNATYNFNQQLSIHTSIFFNRFQNYEPRPFNILSEVTNGIGTRNRLILDRTRMTWIIGHELFVDFHDFTTFENLYQSNNGHGSLQGMKISDLSETRSYRNHFTQLEWRPLAKWRFKSGLNINQTYYQLKDLFNPDTLSLSGIYQYNTILSPSISIAFQPVSNTSLFTSVNHGFSPPTLEETLTPDGTLNTDIVPESGYQWELGVRTFNQKGYISSSVYSIWIQDLLVARRTADDQYIGINAGRTIHQGVEVEANLKIFESEHSSLSQKISGNWGRFRFKEFINDDQRYDGKRLPGVPEWSSFAQWNLQFKSWNLQLTYQGVGNIYLNDSNSISQSAYHLVHSGIGKNFTTNFLQAQLNLSVQNLFDLDYNSMLLVNAVGFGGNEPRYYYPALPRNFQLSLLLSFNKN